MVPFLFGQSWDHLLPFLLQAVSLSGVSTSSCRTLWAEFQARWIDFGLEFGRSETMWDVLRKTILASCSSNSFDGKHARNAFPKATAPAPGKSLNLVANAWFWPKGAVHIQHYLYNVVYVYSVCMYSRLYTHEYIWTQIIYQTYSLL